ncbi:MAG: site-2 protease family protein [Candidatus Aenigmarchaeota archaeon]|nr:site-2 protease family protein [Candidatus Aenigmarchaeota archaeon]
MLNFSDLNILSILIFVLVIAIVVARNRKKFERQAILLLYKTQRGKEMLISLGTSHPRFWKWFGNAGIVAGFASGLYMIYLLLQIFYDNVGRIISGEEPVQALGLVLPTSSTSASFTPGLFLVPFWYWIISIAVLVIFHEGVHGVLCARERIRIKSLGLGLLAVIPLAFVEPDENQLKKRPAGQQMRVFAVGSFANFIIAGVCFLAITFAFSGIFTPGGVIVTGIVNGTPAHQANLSGAIFQIDSYSINDVDDLRNALDRIGPGKSITIQTKTLEDGVIVKKSHRLTTAEQRNETTNQTTGRGFIGITFSPDKRQSTFQEIRAEYMDYEQLIMFFNGLFVFMFIINLGVGMVNMLPIGPLDGGRMWDVTLKKFFPRNYKRIMSGLSLGLLLLIIVIFASQFVRL